MFLGEGLGVVKEWYGGVCVMSALYFLAWLRGMEIVWKFGRYGSGLCVCDIFTLCFELMV